MKPTGRLTKLIILTSAITLVFVPTLASILPRYEVPNFFVVTLVLCGAAAAIYAARRRLVNS